MSRLTEAQLKARLVEIRALPQTEYVWGYRRGINKNHHGARWMTDEDHTRLMALTGDSARGDRGRGYRDGYAGRPPATADEPMAAPTAALRALLEASGVSHREFAALVVARDECAVRRWLDGDEVPAQVLAWAERVVSITSDGNDITILVSR